MKNRLILTLVLMSLVPVFAGAKDYAVVVSKATHANKNWKPVVNALVKKHKAKVIETAIAKIDTSVNLVFIFLPPFPNTIQTICLVIP